MYEGWSREDLLWKIRELKDRIRELEEENRNYHIENDSLRFRIRNELEPRIEREKRMYDAWVTDPERRNR